MIRVCPHSDARCVHGMSCAYTCATDNYDGNKNLSEAMSADHIGDAPGWRDIATAPRDGTGFLVNCPHVEDGVSMMMWDANLFMMVSLFDGKPWVSGLERPTHWQPLPPPPSADAKRSEPDALPGDLREKIAGIIVRKVLQEDYDDLVEGYLDEILMAADEIILLPAYRAVAEAYYSRLSLIQSERGEP